MSSIYLGQFKGYGDSSEYGVFNAYFNYNANGTVLSNMSLQFKKDRDGRYTSNSYFIDSVTIGGTSFSYNPTSGSAYYDTADTGWTNTITGTKDAGGTSCYVEVKMHRSGQNANAQTLSGTVTGLATAPTGCWCSVLYRTLTSVALSGGYQSDGGASVTSTGYQYSTNGSNWSNCNSTVNNLSPNTTYYFRYYATNVVGTSYSENASTTTYDIARITYATDINFGDNSRIVKRNPSGVTNRLRVELLNPTRTIASRDNVGNDYTITFTDEEWDTLYKELGSNNSLTIRYVVDTIQNESTIFYDWVDKTLTLTGNKKVMHINVNNSWKRGNLWINVNNSWKRAVIWTNVNGSWKRGI